MSWFKNNDTTLTRTDAQIYRAYICERIGVARNSGRKTMELTMRELSENTVQKDQNKPNMLQVIKGEILQNMTYHKGVSRKRRWDSETNLDTVWVFKL